MRKISIWFLAVGLLALSVGVAIASNMGFKLNYTLQTNTQNYNLNWVSLPFFYWDVNSSGTITAEDIVADVDNDCGAGTTTSVRYFDTANGQYVSHSAGSTKNDFTISAGVGYAVEISASCTWTIVGSHDNSYDPGGANSISLVTNTQNYNLNWVSVPYHTQSATAEALCTEILNQNGGTGVTSVRYFDTANNIYVSHSCGSTKNDFSLNAGLGIAVEVSSALTWQPTHY